VPLAAARSIYTLVFLFCPASLVGCATGGSDGLRQLTGIRRLKRRRGEAMSEARVTVTTMRR
jgi:hypothetical protein